MTFSVFGQDIKYNLMLKRPCTGEVENAIIYYLEKSGKQFSISDSVGTILLKEPGRYKLFAYMLGAEQEVLVKKGVNRDTLTMVKIEECLEPVGHPSFIGYCCCDLTKCQGKQVDYYNNGNKRIEGNFKDGIAKGKVIYYYPDGKIEKIRVYNKKGILKREIRYDRNGKKVGNEE